jgi:uncharacterized protein YndB with AHSA1/START domain
MVFQDDPSSITWRLHLQSSPEVVYRFLSTDEGRSRFWAESTVETDGEILFQFPDGERWQGRILDAQPNRLYQVEYYGGSVATFLLEPDGEGGTDVTLTDKGVPAAHRLEVVAGWVSVLLALKAAADHGVDLRNHDPQRTWATGYADN